MFGSLVLSFLALDASGNARCNREMVIDVLQRRCVKTSLQ